jgi:hypothetical protein
VRLGAIYMFRVKSVGRAAVPAMTGALAIAMIAASGCAGQNQSSSAAPAPAIAAAATPASPAPVQIQTNFEFGGPEVSIFHPDTKTLYMWSGDPRPGAPHKPMKCIKIQMGDSPSGGPVTDAPCS